VLLRVLVVLKMLVLLLERVLLLLLLERVLLLVLVVVLLVLVVVLVLLEGGRRRRGVHLAKRRLVLVRRGRRRPGGPAAAADRQRGADRRGLIESGRPAARVVDLPVAFRSRCCLSPPRLRNRRACARASSDAGGFMFLWRRSRWRAGKRALAPDRRSVLR